MGVPGTTELVIILVIVVLLFGSKKIPDLASGLGKGIKNFKKSMNSDDEIEVNKEKLEEGKKTVETSETHKEKEASL